MRAIKFRAWDTTENRFHWFELAPGEIWIDKDWEWLQQYTGLKDKNGKEIWEGDILSWNGCRGSVYWDEAYGIWRAFNIGSLGGIPNLEVIGNGYENPDLFK